MSDVWSVIDACWCASRASISENPFYDMLSARRKKALHQKWSVQQTGRRVAQNGRRCNYRRGTLWTSEERLSLFIVSPETLMIVSGQTEDVGAGSSWFERHDAIWWRWTEKDNSWIVFDKITRVLCQVQSCPASHGRVYTAAVTSLAGWISGKWCGVFSIVCGMWAIQIYPKGFGLCAWIMSVSRVLLELCL